MNVVITPWLFHSVLPYAGWRGACALCERE